MCSRSHGVHLANMSSLGIDARVCANAQSRNSINYIDTLTAHRHGRLCHSHMICALDIIPNRPDAVAHKAHASAG